MRHTVGLRGTLVLLLLLSTLSSDRLTASAASCDEPEASPGLGLISEALTVLSSLYVEPLSVSTLLETAAEATRTELQGQGPMGRIPEPPTNFGDDAVAVVQFAGYYCQLWDVARDGSDPTVIAYAGIRAMARSVDEGHTRFMTPEMYLAHQASLSGDQRFEGIGATLRANPLTVDSVIPDSPAAAAGLRAGDQIVAIDGVPAADLSAQEAVRIVRGPAGTAVKLTIRRAGVGDELILDITRAEIRIPTIVSDMVQDVGHLRLTSFPGTPVHDEIARELAWYDAMGARGLILDLRGNSGGRIDTGSRIANLFLPGGAPIFRQTTRSGRVTTRASAGAPVWTKPVVVLIDQGTASMGEILASALQEQAGATLMGTTTAGAVAGSIVVPLSDGSALQVTTFRIDSSMGTVLNVVGLQPDVEIVAPGSGVRGATDPAIDAALAYLQTLPPTRAFRTFGPDLTPHETFAA